MLTCTVLNLHAGAQDVTDCPIHSLFLIDKLEGTSVRYCGGSRSNDALRFNTTEWVGGDCNRLWIHTEGTRSRSGKLERADLQVLMRSNASSPLCGCSVPKS